MIKTLTKEEFRKRLVKDQIRRAKEKEREISDYFIEKSIKNKVKFAKTRQYQVLRNRSYR